MSYATVFPKQLQINMCEVLSALKQYPVFKNFLEYAGIIYSIATVNKEMYMDIIRHLRDMVRRTLLERRKTNSSFCPSRQSCSTLISFGQGFLSNKPM
jgi:hypothetical protein